MRTFASGFQSAIEAATGSRFTALVTITEPAGPTTRRLAPDSLIFAGNTYAAELLDLGGIYDRLSGTDDVRLTMADTASNRAVLVIGATVEIHMLAVSGITAGSPPTYAGDAELMFRGMLADPVEVGGGRISFDAISQPASAHDRYVGDVIDAGTWTSAPADEAGTQLPIVVGTVEHVRCVPVDIGTICSLLLDVDQARDWIAVSAEGAALPSSGVVQVEGEQMLYTTKTAWAAADGWYLEGIRIVP